MQNLKKETEKNPLIAIYNNFSCLFTYYSWFSCDVIIFQNQKNINLCEVLVLSDVRPSKNLRFATFEPDRVPHYVIEYV